MSFSVLILGSNSATPTLSRNPTSQVVSCGADNFLVDCAEGTQMQLMKYAVKRGKIHHIFISHLHGDHYFGLIGLLTSMHLQGREKALWVYGPPLLREIIDIQLRASNTKFHFPLHFVETRTDTLRLLFENEYLSIFSFPLSHSLPTTGFLFREKPGRRRIVKERIAGLNIPPAYFRRIIEGEDFMDEQGKIYRNDYLTAAPPPPGAYAYCSDTAYDERIIPVIEGVDLLYHEATFAAEMEETARERRHSTARDAALIAKKAAVKRLILGHFSSRYDDVSILEKEASAVFPDVSCVADGDVFDV